MKVKYVFLLFLSIVSIYGCNQESGQLEVKINGHSFCLNCYYATDERLPRGTYQVNSSPIYEPSGAYLFGYATANECPCDSLSDDFTIRTEIIDGFLKKIYVFPHVNNDIRMLNIQLSSESFDIKIDTQFRSFTKVIDKNLSLDFEIVDGDGLMITYP
jgi:hypothetical protein